MGSIVSARAIQNYLKQQDGFIMSNDRTFPSLDQQAKLGLGAYWKLFQTAVFTFNNSGNAVD